MAILIIGKKEIKSKDLAYETLKPILEHETMLELIYMKWTDKTTLHFMCGGICEIGHKLISGIARVKE